MLGPDGSGNPFAFVWFAEKTRLNLTPLLVHAKAQGRKVFYLYLYITYISFENYCPSPIEVEILLLLGGLLKRYV